MNAHQTFIFRNYEFFKDQKELRLYYAIDDTIEFCEIYRFKFEFTNFDEMVLDKAIQILFFIAGVSYYKTYLPPQIMVDACEIDKNLSDFLSKTYQKGLGEFFYVNNLDPNTKITFPVTVEGTTPLPVEHLQGSMIGIGGGKDSLVSVEILRPKDPSITTWSIDHKSQLEPLVQTINTPHFWVERIWDRSLLEINNKGAYNGHIPISAIFAAVGTVVAILSGKQDIIVSNEQSANEPTLTYQGQPINHQYSKSQEFETDFQKLLTHQFTNGPRYFSFLRPLSELRIAEIFSKIGFDKYHGVFSSCNRAFTHDNNSMFWDGTCPKCAFIFLALTPFVKREKLEQLFYGKNLLLNPELEPIYKQLLGIEGDKPLECVGEIKESRAAMRLAKTIYPELNRYEFEIPEDYDYKALGSHSMPLNMFEVLTNFMSSL